MNKNRLRKRMGSILLLFMVIFNSCDSGVIDSTNDKLTENTIKKPQNSNEAPKMIEKIEFNNRESHLFLTGGTNSRLLTVTITPENATDKALIWTSFDEKVATVDESGRVTAVSAGETFIGVKPKNGSGKETYCHVIVYSNPQSRPSENNTKLEDILNFVLNNDGRSYSIESVKNDDEIAGEIRIPETYQDYPVTSIQDAAFQGCGNLTKVVLPNSITSIGQGAFMICSNLEEINIPAGVREIKRGIFSNCYNLERVSFQGDVLVIAPYAFDNCSKLEKIQLPDTVILVGSFAFKDCSSLREINTPASLRAIGSHTFGGEENLFIKGNLHICPIIYVPLIRNPNTGDLEEMSDEDMINGRPYEALDARMTDYQEYYDDHILPQLQ